MSRDKLPDHYSEGSAATMERTDMSHMANITSGNENAGAGGGAGADCRRLHHRQEHDQRVRL